LQSISKRREESNKMAKPFVDGDGDDIRAAYEDVRNDDTETNW